MDPRSLYCNVSSKNDNFVRCDCHASPIHLHAAYSVLTYYLLRQLYVLNRADAIAVDHDDMIPHDVADVPRLGYYVSIFQNYDAQCACFTYGNA